MFFSSGTRTWGFLFYKELLPCGERSVSLLLPFLFLCVLFFRFPGPLEAGLHRTVVVPDSSALDTIYNRSGLPGQIKAPSPAVWLMSTHRSSAASLALTSAAVSGFQLGLITNHVIILQHCLRLYVLKPVLCSSSLSGRIIIDGLCRCSTYDYVEG